MDRRFLQLYILLSPSPPPFAPLPLSLPSSVSLSLSLPSPPLPSPSALTDYDVTGFLSTIQNILPGSTRHNFSVKIIEDSTFEGNENFSLTLTVLDSGPLGITVAMPDVAMVTFVDNESKCNVHHRLTPITMYPTTLHPSQCTPPHYTHLNVHHHTTPITMYTTTLHPSQCTPPHCTHLNVHHHTAPILMYTTTLHQSQCTPPHCTHLNQWRIQTSN